MKMIVLLFSTNKSFKSTNTFVAWIQYLFGVRTISWAIFQFRLWLFFFLFFFPDFLFQFPIFIPLFQIQLRNAMPNCVFVNKKKKEKNNTEIVPFYNSFETNCYSQFASCNMMFALHFPLPSRNEDIFFGKWTSKWRGKNLSYNFRLEITFTFVGGV